MLTPLEVRQLRSFVAVAQEGQVTRAANKLYIAQPALSQMLTKLEAQVGTALLERHPRGVHLTPAGRIFLEKARVASAAVENAEREAEALGRAARSSLAWGFTGAPPMVEAPDLFAAFTRARPDVDIVFRQLPSPRESTAAWLAPVDIALTYAPTAHPDVETLRISEEPRVALLAADHPLAGRDELDLADVLDETFCGYDEALEHVRAGFWTLDDHRGGPATVTSDDASSSQEVFACVAAGRGIATGPRSEVDGLLRSAHCVTCIPIRDARPAPLSIVWRKQGSSDAARDLVRLARGPDESAQTPNGEI